MALFFTRFISSSIHFSVSSFFFMSAPIKDRHKKSVFPKIIIPDAAPIGYITAFVPAFRMWACCLVIGCTLDVD
jgi:hypothetical protein